jgi:2-polyprenyl-6-methoxyphenol hydroxylase-like FAD-dependent oxidoreductase
VVLIGDAAGHNDPVIGQGLSIGLRDARLVRDLVLDGARDASAFVSYGSERMERMRRLRLIADILAMVRPRTAIASPPGANSGEKMARWIPRSSPRARTFWGPRRLPTSS